MSITLSHPGSVLRVIVLSTITAILGAALILIWRTAHTLVPNKFLIINSHSITIELFDTPQLRMQGLSGRTSLEPDSGALFVYEQPDLQGIWMKDMRFPIDVLWLDTEGRIIYLVDDMQPSSYPQAYQPTQPAAYVLELPSSAIASYQIKLGDKIDNLPSLR